MINASLKAPRFLRKVSRAIRHNIPPPPKFPNSRRLARRLRRLVPPLPTIPRLRRIIAWIKARQRRRRAFVVCAVFMVLGLSGWFFGPPVSHRVKGWQARRIAAQADELIRHEQWADASKKLRAAMQLRPSEPAVWAATARLLSRAGRGDLALVWWRKFSETQRLSVDDRRDFASAALLANDLRTAGDQIDALPAAPGNPADALLRAQYASSRGELASTRRYAIEILSDPAASARQSVAAATLLASAANDPDDLRSAYERLINIARGDQTDASANALTALARAYIVSPTDERSSSSGRKYPPIARTELAERLEQHPLTRPIQKMLGLELRLLQDPSQESELIKQAIRKYGRGDDEAVSALCNWLYSRRHYDIVLRILTIEKASQTRELFMERVDSLAQLGRFDELRAELLTENPILDSSLQHALLAVVRLKLGEVAAGKNEWERAVANADDVQKLMTIGLYAEKNGATDVADTAYERATGRQTDLRAAYFGRLRIAQMTEDTNRAYQVLSAITKRWPKDRESRVGEIFLRLLLYPSAETAKAAEGEIATLLGMDPADPFARRAMALALLRQGRNAAALDILPQPQPGDPPSAVLAAAWAANGWQDKAREEAHRLTIEKLFPEERALIAGIK